MGCDTPRTGDLELLDGLAASDVERHFVRFATAFATIGERREYLRSPWHAAGHESLHGIDELICRAAERGLSSSALATLRLHRDLLAIHFTSCAAEIWAEFEPPPDDVLDAVLALDSGELPGGEVDPADGAVTLLSRPEVRNAAHYLRALWHDDPERYDRLRRRLEPFRSPTSVLIGGKRYAAGKVRVYSQGDLEFAPKAREALRDAVRLEIHLDRVRFAAALAERGVPVDAIERFVATLEVDDQAWLQDEWPHC